jgi:hypothetical protein
MSRSVSSVILALTAVIPLTVVSRPPDIRPPEVSLSAAPDLAAPVHTLDASVLVDDDRGIASVWISMDGKMESGRAAG